MSHAGPAEAVFWTAATIIAYTYVGYPLLLYVMTRQRRSISPAGSAWPRVTLIISAYNEKEVMAEKLLNALELDYPRDLLEILVVSDASDDGTDEIVTGFEDQNVRLIRQTQRLGKSAGLNLGVGQAHGEIIIFSDANALYEPSAIRNLVRHFSEPRAGYVVGNARYSERPGQTASAESEGIYWRLETWLKEKESLFGSVVGGDGAIYAIRRELFTPLLVTDINDFLNPLQIVSKGYRGVYDKSAVCYEEAGDSFGKEFRRKVRIVSRSINAVFRAPRVLLPWTQPRHWLALVSHKALRWLAPVFLLILFVATLALVKIPFYQIALWMQGVFYGMALAGWKLERRIAAPRFLYLPLYFCVVNLAALLGLFRFLTGSLAPTWETIRQRPQQGEDSHLSLVRKDS